MRTREHSAEIEPVENLIQIVRGQRVILDADLARVYGVTTKMLNQAIKRNIARFPSDFMFQLAAEEVAHLRSQIVTSSGEGMRSQIVTGSVPANRSQIVTGSQKHRDPRYLPYAFTEYGAFQAANVLRSSRAIQMSVFVVRAFVKMREALAGHRDLALKLVELERTLTGRLDDHEAAITDILRELRRLVAPSSSERKPIGFHVRERRATYRARAQFVPKHRQH